MKRFFTILLIAIASFSLAQMTVSKNGAKVTFSYTLEAAIWNSAPVYLYCYIDPTDTTPAIANTISLGGWPGPMMSGTGPYTATYDLAAFGVPIGTTVNNIKYIFNNNAGNQNPGGNQPGFNANALASWSNITVFGAGVNDISNLDSKSAVVNGKLYTEKTGALNIEVYDFTGKSIKTQNVNATGDAIDLQLPEKGNFILRISDGEKSETLKFKN